MKNGTNSPWGRGAEHGYGCRGESGRREIIRKKQLRRNNNNKTTCLSSRDGCGGRRDQLFDCAAHASRTAVARTRTGFWLFLRRSRPSTPPLPSSPLPRVRRRRPDDVYTSSPRRITAVVASAGRGEVCEGGCHGRAGPNAVVMCIDRRGDDDECGGAGSGAGAARPRARHYATTAVYSAVRRTRQSSRCTRRSRPALLSSSLLFCFSIGSVRRVSPPRQERVYTRVAMAWKSRYNVITTLKVLTRF